MLMLDAAWFARVKGLHVEKIQVGTVAGVHKNKEAGVKRPKTERISYYGNMLKQI